MSEHSAVPLCLPNNCKWDEQTGEYSKDEDQDRTKLNLINAALEQLKAIKGWRNGMKMKHFSLPFFVYNEKDTNKLSSGVTLSVTFFNFW